MVSSSEFENLIYDLLILKGLVNVVWRTPGADGGRDIEADSVHVDASSLQSLAKWYVECKRYSGSVDWPTIHPKLAYADAAGAEYLLLCTTSKFTPQAISNCDQWNRTHRFPKLRLWANHDISAQLVQFPDLRWKYGLLNSPKTPGRSIVSIALALSKTIGTFYSATASSGVTPERMLSAAFAISLLLQQRMEDIEMHGSITRRPLLITNGLAIDADFIGTPQNIDEPALVAFCSYLCALVQSRLQITFTNVGAYTITGTTKFSDVMHRYRDSFSAIALWGEFEFTFNATKVEVQHR